MTLQHPPRRTNGAADAFVCPCERNLQQQPPPPPPAMSKSRSWPMLFTVPEEEAVAGPVAAADAATVTVATVEAVARRPPDGHDGAAVQAQHQQQRQQYRHRVTVQPAVNVGRLLRRHYYPEAGWGWVVVACACMVHLLNHGLQLSFGTLERDVVQRFRDAAYSSTGQSSEMRTAHGTLCTMIKYMIYLRIIGAAGLGRGR